MTVSESWEAPSARSFMRITMTHITGQSAG